MIASRIDTDRLVLLPLRVRYAEEMAEVLADPGLYAFIGGEPPTAAALAARYERQTAGSPDPSEVWLNWVISSLEDDALVGYVQATVNQPDKLAEVAWVVGTSWQGRGYAKEAARALVGWLEDRGVRRVVAHVNPDHVASAQVAAAAGLVRTDHLHDGEYRWQRDL
ncbi:MAG TPA: GNAT family N-acetyltransferase [Kribbella sp.]|nr:GNAT family N-acetyltransferase [Kribbella sp.]